MSLRRICSLSVQSLKHLRLKNKNKIQSHTQDLKNRLRSQNPTQSHKPQQREERRTCEFVRSAAKRSSDSRASAPFRGRSESGLAYPLRPESSLSSPQHTDLHKTLVTSPNSPVSHPAQKTTHQSIIPGASQPN
jgi:hypothetical protein